jgi:succinate-semialdehyde dehydrogenase / glutarate-semialdehyde dehydrogenase
MQSSNYPELKVLIDGTWRQGAGERIENVLNPATNTAIANFQHADVADFEESIFAAKMALPSWRNMTAVDRSAILRKAATLMREREQHIATVITLEQGKSLIEAKAELNAAIVSIEWMAEEGRRLYGRLIPGPAGTHQIVQPEPVGVVAAFCPWNFPILIPARKISAALAAGCTIIIKPSEETPGATIEMAKCFLDAGLPKGVLNVVFGDPPKISEFLIRAKPVRKISFTGSVTIGRKIATIAADGLKRLTMELGGHAPVVVCADADIAASAKLLAGFKYRNAGQVCIAPTRFYVHEAAILQFTAEFKAAVDVMQVGNGLDPKTTMGPLANSRRVDAMELLVEDIKRRGGKLVKGGHRIGNSGNFFEPTIVTNIDDDADIMLTEPFGPIAPIVPFRDLDEVITRANSLPFGLAAYAFTKDSKKAREIASRLEAGMVGINSIAISTPETPFGGVKDSGYGQECGSEGLDAHTIRKFVSYS